MNTPTFAAITALGLAAAAHAVIVIGPGNHAFVDISVTGTNIAGISDDSEITVTGAALTGAGWAGNGLLAGNVSIRVGNNGCIIWGNSATDAFANATDVGYLNPNANYAGYTSLGTITASNLATNGNAGSGPRQLVCVLWDDNIPAATGTSTKWQVIGGNLIVQWTNEDHFNAQGGGVITYEVIVYGGVTIASGNPLVEFVYQDTLYAANQYQDDGGSATIGYKNWGVNAGANDVEFGTSGGSGGATTDPAYGDPTMQPKVAGWVAANNTSLPHSVVIRGRPPCDSADFDCDGDTATDADIEAFFRCIAGVCPQPPCTNSADFNHDGDVATDADIEAFFRVLAGNPC
jgi:hypothetical protein